MKLSLVLLALCLVVLPVSATLIQIPSDYPSIQEGLNAAVDGDTVLVAPGTYMENLIVRSKNVMLASHYILEQDPMKVLETIIDGSFGASTDTGTTVLFHDVTGTGAALIGFTIQGGGGSNITGQGGTAREGGGVLLWNPSVREDTNVRVEYNLIRDNHVGHIGPTYYGGGGLSTWRIHIECHGNYFLENSSNQYVGGMVTNFGTARITNNIFDGNECRSSFGGGSGLYMYFGGDSLLVENNTFSDNRITDAGTGYVVRLLSNAHATFRNNLITELTNQISTASGASIEVSYSMLPSEYEGEGNVADTARFVEDSFMLLPDSPGVDAGNPAMEYNDPASAAPAAARLPARGTLRNDVGVYGGPGTPAHELFRVIETSLQSEHSSQSFPDRFVLSEAWPNPFNASTRLTITLPASEHLQVRVFDLLGREMSSLIDQRLSAGQHQMTLNADNWPSGTYLVHANNGQQQQIQRITLVK